MSYRNRLKRLSWSEKCRCRKKEKRFSHKRGYQPLREEKMTSQMFMRSLKPAILPLCLPIIVIGTCSFFCYLKLNLKNNRRREKDIQNIQ